MTLEAIYYVGQTIAVFAVLISIIFVGFQIRQNTKALKATSHHAITDSFNQMNSIVGTSVQAGRLWRLGLAGLGNLDEDEQMSFAYLMLAYMRVFETLYYQNKNGTMEAQLFESEKRSLKWAFAMRGARDWWATNPISFSDQFRAFIDEIIEETPNIPSDSPQT